MGRGVRLLSWVVVAGLAVGLLAYLFGPSLLASVAYPLPAKYQPAIAKYSQEYGISPNLLCGLIVSESNWRENARSSAGAVGLTQVIPSTGRAIASRLGVTNFSPNDLITDPELSIRFGAYYIADAIRRNGGNETLGLIAYNGGQGAVNAYQRGYPVRGTVGYANRVLAVEGQYDKIYGQWWNRPDLPLITARPKVTDLLPKISPLDFWRTLIFAPSDSSKTGADQFDDFWQDLLPAN